MKKASCNVRETRARLEQFLEDWQETPRTALPAWAKVIAREAGVRAADVEGADEWQRRWLLRELTDQVTSASSSQVCGYGHVLDKYMGEGRRFRKRLSRTKLAGMRRYKGRK